MADSFNFLKPYLRGWPILVGAMILAYAMAGKYLNYVTPMYESTAKLRLADMNEGVPNSNLFKDLDVFATTQKINAEIELLKSSALISKALSKIPFEVQIFRSGNIRKTELFNNSPVLISTFNWQSSLYDKTFKLTVAKDLTYTLTLENGEVLSGQLGNTLKIDSSLITISLNNALVQSKKNLQIADNYLFSVLSREKQISEINSQIDIIAVDKDVPVIRISFKSSHPTKAALFPNALAEAYIEDYIENKYGAANVTVDFLNDRIAEISKKLDNSEQMILSYRDEKNITNIAQETETELRKISQLKIQQTNLKMSLEAIRDLESYIQSGKENFLALAPNFEAFTDLLSTEIIKNIKQLQAEKKDLLLQYTPKDPKVMVVDAKLKDLTSYLIESISNTRKNLETKYNKLNSDIEKAELVFIDVPEKERMMTILNREFQIFQQSYDFLNQKKIEAEIAKAAKIAFHRVITPAIVSSQPVSPNRTIIKIVSAILGLMGAVILIFIIHAMKARVNDVSTVESSSMIPIVALVPKLETKLEIDNFFVKTLTEWEVKGLLKAGNISCFTGFNNKHGVGFITSQLTEVLNTQQRNTLLLEIQQDAGKDSQEFAIEEKLSEQLTKITISEAKLKLMTTKAWQTYLHDKAAGYEYTLLLNTVFGEAYTTATMATAALNMVCIDTRLTPAKRITDVDLLVQEYQLPQVHFAINRVGYNPSFVRELTQYLFATANIVKRKSK